ncbi:hypothetical protein KY285_008139 [Solanum tuberosum]|nr:hypothetical protein KY285_008139 [Solanum tuberosum]
MRSVGAFTTRGTLNEIALCQSPNKSYETSGGTVLMGNNATCKIVGIGSVHVRYHDGIVRTIIEVRHVPVDTGVTSPDLKKNLISLGTLDKQGYKYMSERGTMKVTKGSLVMLKAKLGDGLYTLAGTTIISSKSRKRSASSMASTLAGEVLDYIHSYLWGLSKLPSKGERGSWIARHKTVRHIPQQNRVAERMNITLLGKARWMLLQTKMSKVIWAEAVHTASHIVNRSPASVIDFKTPNEVWLVSKDVTFDESFILDPCKVYVEFSRNENNEKVELLMELTKEQDQETQIDESKMQILKNLLSMNHTQLRREAAEEQIKDLEPYSYVEDTSCKDVAQW